MYVLFQVCAFSDPITFYFHISINFFLATTPQIVLHPESREVFYGQPVQLHIKVSNPSSSTRYQWYLNQRPLTSQTSPRLAIYSVVDSDEGEYICVVSDAGHTVRSRSAVVKLFCQDYQAQHFYMPVGQVQHHPSMFDGRQVTNQRLELDNLLGRDGQSAYTPSNEQQTITGNVAPKDHVGKSSEAFYCLLI